MPAPHSDFTFFWSCRVNYVFLWIITNFPWNDDPYSLFNPNVAITELHAKPPLDHQKKLVFVVIMVPDERPLELDQLHVLAVQLAHFVGNFNECWAASFST